MDYSLNETEIQWIQRIWKTNGEWIGVSLKICLLHVSWWLCDNTLVYNTGKLQDRIIFLYCNNFFVTEFNEFSQSHFRKTQMKAIKVQCEIHPFTGCYIIKGLQLQSFHNIPAHRVTSFQLVNIVVPTIISSLQPWCPPWRRHDNSRHSGQPDKID